MIQPAFQDILQVLTKYFDALYECDVEKMSLVFHPQAIYATADEAPFLHRAMEDYFPVLAARQSPASREEPRRDYVDEIQFAGENTAFTRVRCSIGDRNFVDFLTLVRVNNRWQVIAKVFQIINSNK